MYNIVATLNDKIALMLYGISKTAYRVKTVLLVSCIIFVWVMACPFCYGAEDTTGNVIPAKTQGEAIDHATIGSKSEHVF
jgi:hypothetical protein